MKNIIVFLVAMFSQSLFSQFDAGYGIIVDKDGYANVRKKGNAKSEIIGRINSGEVVMIYQELEKETWHNVFYEEGATFSGFVHTSRLRFLSDLPQIPLLKQEKNVGFFGNKDIKIQISTKKVLMKDEKKHISVGLRGDLYKGRPFYGVEVLYPFSDDVEFEKFDNISVTFQGKAIVVPERELETLFDIHEVQYISCHYDKNTHQVFITTSIGDGAGGASVVFVFKDGQFKARKVSRH